MLDEMGHGLERPLFHPKADIDDQRFRLRPNVRFRPEADIG